MHFNADDIIQNGSRKELRCGALPLHHLPKKDLREVPGNLFCGLLANNFMLKVMQVIYFIQL